MVDEVDIVVEAVSRLPVDYEELGRYSARELVRRTGFKNHRPRVTVERIQACLAEHPDWVDAWFGWSEDNRGVPAWYVLRSGPDVFRVGRIDHESESEPLVFDDRVRACAEYVHREVAAIADWH